MRSYSIWHPWVGSGEESPLSLAHQLAPELVRVQEDVLQRLPKSLATKCIHRSNTWGKTTKYNIMDILYKYIKFREKTLHLRNLTFLGK